MKTRRHVVTCLRGITLAIALSLAPVATLWADLPKPAASPPPSMADAQPAYGQLPLSFEETQGQTDNQVNYLARGHGYQLLLTPSETLLALRPPTLHSSANPSFASRPLNGEGGDEGTLLRLQLVRANLTSTVRGLEELPGKVNYFIGNDPEKWRTDVPTFAKVTQLQVYPGIDVVYYGNQQQIEFDFIVAPGADPTEIRLKVDGADRLEIDTQGDLLLHVNNGAIQLQRPRVYQEVAGLRREVSGHYVVNDAQEVSFQVAAYDENRPLVIDPVLIYSTYLGGNNNDVGQGIAVDASGHAYVTGWTQSADFPTTPGAFQTEATILGSQRVAFVTKLNPTGSALVYSTYLGEVTQNASLRIAVDGSGHAYVTGSTQSADFPTTPGAFQAECGDCSRTGSAFVTKLNPTGSGLVYSTYLGPASRGEGIAVDGSGNAYVTGWFSPTYPFPTTPGAFQTTSDRGDIEAFVTKLNPTGSDLVYSTYLGGTTYTQSRSIAVDASGHAYVTGETAATDFPITPGAFQTTAGGFFDAFITKLNPTGSGLVYSTYLGGNDHDASYGIAVDGLGNAYVSGYTNAGTFPTTPGAFKPTSGGADGFVTKLNAAGTALIYSTYLGDGGNDIAVDGSGNAYVSGGFVTKLNPTGSGLVYSTYLGSFGIAVDASGNAYVTGATNSGTFPTTPGAFQATYGGGGDAFVAKITFPTNISPLCNAAQANPASLWTPNGQFVPIVVTGVTDPDGGSVTITVTAVTQDELVYSKGGNKTSPDAVIQAGSASLRAERLDTGNGRVYQISFRADDGMDGFCTGAVTVGVPLSLKKGLTAIDDGQVYDSTIP